MSELRHVLREMASDNVQRDLYDSGLKFSYRAAIQYADETLERYEVLHQFERRHGVDAGLFHMTPMMASFIFGVSIGVIVMGISTI